MLVCELCHQNVMVFGTQDGSARFLGAVTGHQGAASVLVALHLGGEEGRVRSHFQRLVLLDDLRRAEGKSAREKEEGRAQRRGGAEMSHADVQGQQCRCWLTRQ